MILKFAREKVWWLCQKLQEGELSQYSFVWPMVLQWLKDQTEEDNETKGEP